MRAVLGLALVIFACAVVAQDKPVVVPRKEALTEKDADWVKTGDGKLTEAELIARFGPPDEIRSPGRADADYVLVWQDRTVIRVKYEGGKLAEFSGKFSPRLPDKKATPESLKRLRIGQTRDAVEEVLGATLDEDEKAMTARWGVSRTVLAYIKAGKVAGSGWETSLAD